MNNILDNFLMLLQFFTRIPIKKNFDYSMDNFKSASSLLSIIGLLIGVITSLFTLILIELRFIPIGVVSTISIIFYVLITGAFHLDGLSDTSDGVFSGRSRERILEIMKDSRIGSYGTIAIILSILLRYSILSNFVIYSRVNLNVIYFLPLLPMMGKFGLFIIGYKAKRAKEISSGNYFINNSSYSELLFNILTVLSYFLIIGLILGMLLKMIIFSVALLISVTLISLLLKGYFEKKIGGLVGDNLGFCAEVCELITGILSLICLVFI